MAKTPVPDLLGDKRLVFSDHVAFTRLRAPDRYPEHRMTELEQDFDRLFEERIGIPACRTTTLLGPDFVSA